MELYELRIEDRQDDDYYVLPLLRLMEAMDTERADVFMGRWFLNRDVWGHGMTVDNVAYQAENKNAIPVNVMNLFRLMRLGREDFYRAHFARDFEGLSIAVEFGITGRTGYLFVISNDERFLDDVASHFRKTEIQALEEIED